MKHILLLAGVFALSLVSNAQCTADYDFGDAAFGVSPDPMLGETFEIGVLGEAYADVIHIKVPTSAADIDETLPAEAPVDSVIFQSVSFVLGGTTYTTAEMGLEIVCNNNGDSNDPCTFLGGNQYCALLQGTPLIEGEFQMIITVTGWTTVFGIAISQDIDFDQYTFIVTNGVNVAESATFEVALEQNVPNPADDRTTIAYTLNRNSVVKITVTNLLGETVIEQLVNGQRGQNSERIDVSMLNNGIYLYSIEAEGKKFTKRMIINR